jgi:acyl-CoA thioesterase-2
MKTNLPRLLEILNLEQLEERTFKAGNLFIGSPQIYGGQVLAQAIRAAQKTLDTDKKTLHSIHGYFLAPGNNEKDVQYEVEVIKNGRSFSNRRVLGKQGDRTIFLCALSFHIAEEGFSHMATMPNVTQPESLTPFSEVFAQFAEKFDVKPRGFYSAESPILFHPVEHYNPFNPGKRPPRLHVWFKPNGEIPEDELLGQAMLAYVSDFSLLISGLLPHDVSMFTEPMHLASLDHAMWFHRKTDFTDWHLYAVNSSNAGSARAFCEGKIYNRAGDLIASVTQEGLIRKLA